MFQLQGNSADKLRTPFCGLFSATCQVYDLIASVFHCQQSYQRPEPNTASQNILHFLENWYNLTEAFLYHRRNQ